MTPKLEKNIKYKLDQHETLSPSFKNEEESNLITNIFFQDEKAYLKTQRNSLTNIKIDV